MPIFITHRINKVNDLLKVNPKDGIETDIRDFNKELVLSHDPYKNSEKFKKFIKFTKRRLIFLNIKSYGIINDILKIIKNKKNIYFLDLTFSEIDYLISKKLSNKIILRFSAYEKFDLKKKYFKKIDWIWYDFFKNKYISKKEYLYLNKFKKKICLVSPELLNKSKQDVIKFIKHLNKNNINVDAICTKNKFILLWKKYYKYK
jgi:hypothetical protein|tara:strand:+ start:273 stop:881 length:609 start_codon:yes stop_codon:yes gene_type:complete